jgi:MFS family permease
MDKKVFGVLFFSIFAAITGVGIVVPLLPVYAHDLGAGGFYIGMIFGAFSLSRTFLLPYFGRRSDIHGRKPLIVAGLLCYALVSVAFVCSRSVEHLIIIRFLQGIASAMIMPVVQAYVGDITPPGKEGFTMGLFNMSMFMGLSAGPLIGGLINDNFSLKIAFICMGILALVGFFLSLFMLPPVSAERVLAHKRVPVPWHALLKDREIAALFSFRFVYTLCIGMIWGFMPILADSEFSLSSTAIGILVMLAVCVSGLLTTPMGYVADRINKRWMVILGGMIIALAVLSFYRATGFRDLFAANVMFGIGGGIAMPALMALAVIKGQRAEAMGSVMALLTMAHSFGMFLGALLGGLMMDMFQLRQAFAGGSAIMVAGVMLFAILTRPIPNLAKPKLN